MSLAALTFSGWNWLWPAAGFLLVSVVVLLWSYRASPGGGLRWVCLAMKALGLLALALCLLEPLWFGQRARPGANLFAVVADNSQGMQIKDAGDQQTRGEFLQKLVDPAQADWLATLGDTFDVRRYVFDTRLQATTDFHELVFDGRATAIGTALHTLADRFQGRPIAGVILLTDGNATDLHDPLPDLSKLPPVYPVVIGRRDPVRDISVQQVTVTQTAFEDAPVSVQADVVATGFRGQPISARLTDKNGKVVEEQTMEGRGEGDNLAFRFQLKPEQKGLSFYQVRVGLREPPGVAAAAAPAAGATDSGEATLANNARVLVVNRGEGPYRVLYVSGRPNWEYKFLNRAVQEDKEIDLVGLIRVAKREPKFDFRGRVGESSNPLFRGFGDQSPEAVQSYDQPVLIRLNTRDEVELRSGFPRVPEDLYGYNAVIVGDLEAEFFAPDQALLLQKFVSERGGGFLMLGGMESFEEGKYQRTPVGDMLPIYLDPPRELPAPTVEPRLELTREGWLLPWARLRDNESDERARREAMPGFSVVNHVRGVKPGASVIATLRDPNGAEIPALVSQRFGRGRTAALMIGDLWSWGFKNAELHADLDKTWRQLVRWLVSDVPRRVELAVEPQPEDANNAVQLQVRVRDEKYQPLDDAGVTIEVQPVLFEGTAGAMGNAIRLQAEPSLNEAGLYQATYIPRLTGGYKATAIVTNTQGAEVGRADAGWSVDLAAEEFRSLTPNRPLLEAIARKTGGQVVEAADLDSFTRKLPGFKAPVMETWSYPLWHTPLIFAFAVGCLLAEWGLRRWKGLP
ncbi:MAG TPA: glutamine amidotransferase [Opitutaceae bacterium]|nr:glutamine amidotransferase [Opitutaceae bacterium]